MANLAQTIKYEISRLARKEVKAFVSKLQKEVVALKKRVAQQKRQLRALDINQKSVQARLPKTGATPSVQPDALAKFRIQGRGIRSLRKRLGLSQASFGKLVGVAGLTVLHWEQKRGMLGRLSDASKAKLMWAKGLGARDAKRLVETAEKETAAKAPKGRKPRKTARRKARK